MGEPQLGLLPDVSAELSADLDLSNCSLGTSARLCREHLSEKGIECRT